MSNFFYSVNLVWIIKEQDFPDKSFTRRIRLVDDSNLKNSNFFPDESFIGRITYQMDNLQDLFFTGLIFYKAFINETWFVCLIKDWSDKISVL